MNDRDKANDGTGEGSCSAGEKLGNCNLTLSPEQQDQDCSRDNCDFQNPRQTFKTRTVLEAKPRGMKKVLVRSRAKALKNVSNQRRQSGSAMKIVAELHTSSSGDS